MIQGNGTVPTVGNAVCVSDILAVPTFKKQRLSNSPFCYYTNQMEQYPKYSPVEMWWHTVTHSRGSEGETGEWSG